MNHLINLPWVGGTALWALVACAPVAWIWGPSVESIGITAVIAVVLSVLLGNGGRP